MADATKVTLPNGWRMHTGTDATVVTTDKVKLRCIKTMGTAGAETVLVTDTAGNTLCKTVATANQTQNQDFWGKDFEGLKVTLSASTVQALIIID